MGSFGAYLDNYSIALAVHLLFTHLRRRFRQHDHRQQLLRQVSSIAAVAALSPLVVTQSPEIYLSLLRNGSQPFHSSGIVVGRIFIGSSCWCRTSRMKEKGDEVRWSGSGGNKNTRTQYTHYARSFSLSRLLLPRRV